MANDDQPVTFRVHGIDYQIPTDFDIGEMIDAERFFNVEFSEDMSKGGIRLAAAMLWIAIHRVDPSVTVDDIRALPPDVFAPIMEEAEEELPPVSEPEETSDPEPPSEPSGSDSPPDSDAVTNGRSHIGIPA